MKKLFVFTPAGTAVLVIALFILIRALLTRNSYETVLGIAIILLLLLLGFIGFWKSRPFKTQELVWKTPFPFTANTAEKTQITVPQLPVPLFFRIHVIIQGRFFPSASKGSIGAMFYTETAIPRNKNEGKIKFSFPMSGRFIGTAYCRIRDIFGFFSFSCINPQQRSIIIRSAPSHKTQFPINAQSGAEDRHYKSSGSEERYYMREYSPGDRSRDINWKSSERIDSLITRISPDNQEKVNRIEVYFRNYGHSGKAALNTLWLLDRAKARLSLFLRCLMEEQAKYIFQIHSALEYWEIANNDDLDAFLEELAVLSFSPPQDESFTGTGSQGELFVFSTACDIGLPAFLLSCMPRPVSIFLVQPAMPEIKIADIETLRIRDFITDNCVPVLRWFKPGKTDHLKVFGTKMEIAYAETRL